MMLFSWGFFCFFPPAKHVCEEGGNGIRGFDYTDVESVI